MTHLHAPEPLKDILDVTPEQRCIHGACALDQAELIKKTNEEEKNLYNQKLFLLTELPDVVRAHRISLRQAARPTILSCAGLVALAIFCFAGAWGMRGLDDFVPNFSYAGTFGLLGVMVGIGAALTAMKLFEQHQILFESDWKKIERAAVRGDLLDQNLVVFLGCTHADALLPLNSDQTKELHALLVTHGWQGVWDHWIGQKKTLRRAQYSAAERAAIAKRQQNDQYALFSSRQTLDQQNQEYQKNVNQISTRRPDPPGL